MSLCMWQFELAGQIFFMLWCCFPVVSLADPLCCMLLLGLLNEMILTTNLLTNLHEVNYPNQKILDCLMWKDYSIV